MSTQHNMSHLDMESLERLDSEQAGQSDMLQALRSASLPDEFWIYSYKILPCPHGYRHSWTHCPFSHVGETARRRCPRANSYLPDPCVNARAKRQCPNGDVCPYAHNTFEQWLHPARYRTRLCYLGANCRRPTCFFAHSVEELRSVEENDSVAPSLQPNSASASLPPLCSPPFLSPSPSTSSSVLGSGPSSEVTVVGGLPAGTSIAPAAAPTSAPTAVGAKHFTALPPGMPMNVLQPVMLMGIPQPHQALRSDLMPPPHSTMQCFMPYQPRPAYMPQPMPMSQPPLSTPSRESSTGPPQLSLQMQVPPPPPGTTHLTAVAVRPSPQAHRANPQTAAVTFTAVHPSGTMHLAPAGAVFLHGNAPPPPLPMGASMHGPPLSPPPLSSFGCVSPFVSSGAFPRGREGVPPSITQTATGRARSYSTPGETAYVVNAGTPFSGVGSSSRTYGNGVQSAIWVGADTSRRAASSVASPWPRTMQPSRSGGLGGRGAGGGGNGAVAPRHMPAPTNRGHVVRRTSTPADVSQASAAITAAAAVNVMYYQVHSGSADGSPLHGASTCTLDALPPHLQEQQASVDDIDAALQACSLSTKSIAAPPPTPSGPLMIGCGDGGSGGGAAATSSLSMSSSLSSSPLSAIASATAAGSPTTARTLSYNTVAATAGAVAHSADLSIIRGHPYLNGMAVGSAFSRPSSSGSASSVGSIISAYECRAAAAAAALAAVSAGAEVAAAAASSMQPCNLLLQHVLRSASAPSSERPQGLLPALLSDLDTVHADLYYDDSEVGILDERSSDPGPSLRAAIHRISSEYGNSAACRNSDPGQSLSSTTTSDMHQLLLPLLQSVLTEGLATGQFELVNGQLQVKSGGDGGAAAICCDSASGAFAVPSAAATAEAASVGISME